MKNKVYQLKIFLLDSYPLIWRTILVYADTSLIDMHRILQTTMGWTNSHLHEFSNGKHRYSAKEFEVEGTRNSDDYLLSSLLKKQGDVITYEYDFGDGWIHRILLQKIIEAPENTAIPVCLDGERHCPPEDCGGMSGYEDMQFIIKNPKHSEYRETRVWLGRKFDPESFDLKRVNKLLKSKNYGCIWL